MNPPEKKPTKTYTFETAQVLSVALEMGFIIALPIVLLGFGGKWLDQRFHTRIFVYIAIVLSLLLSGLWLYRSLKLFVTKLKQASGHKESNKSSEQDNQKKE